MVRAHMKFNQVRRLLKKKEHFFPILGHQQNLSKIDRYIPHIVGRTWRLNRNRNAGEKGSSPEANVWGWNCIQPCMLWGGSVWSDTDWAETGYRTSSLLELGFNIFQE